jgi:hypothetical protein
MMSFDSLLNELRNMMDARGAYQLRLEKKIAELEAELATLKEAAQWIPVEERLPPEPGWVIAWNKLTKSSPACWHGAFWTTETGEVWDNHLPTHWRPLPQPPEVIRPLEDVLKKWIDELIQSVGIMATFKPTMEMNINKPVDMALEVSNYIVGLNQRISALEAECDALKAENADLKQEMSDKCERCCNEHGC